MSLSNLRRFSPGLNDDAETQNAETIINIDTGDADENGLPIDTSDVPEADIAGAEEETAVAVEAQSTAEDAGESVDNLDKVEEALECLHRERRGPTAMEAMLIDHLANGAISKLYPAASREQRLSGVFGSGLNSIAGADHSMVVAALNETKKGIGDTLKEWIRKVVEFFKGIGKAITKWLSGSAKLSGRADEILKRANGELANTSASGKKVQLNNPGIIRSGQANKGEKAVGLAAAEFRDFLKTNLVDGNMYKEASKGVVDLAGGADAKSLSDADVKSNMEKIVAGATKAMGAQAGRSSTQHIGGLETGIVHNVEEYRLTAYARRHEVTETGEWDVLTKESIVQLATAAKAIISHVQSYQDGWKERDRLRGEWEKTANKISSENASDHKGEKDDGMIKKFKTKRKIAKEAGTTLMSVQGFENSILGHGLKVAAGLLDYCDKSLKVLDKKDDKDDKK